MLVIEFLGTPYSGKSYYKDEIERDVFFKNFKIYNYRKNFFCNLTDIENVNFLQKNILRFYCNKATIDAKKKFLSIKKKKNFLNKFFQNEINKLIKSKSDSFKRKNIEFSKLINDYLENSKETNERNKNLSRWTNELFASHEISSLIDSNKKIIIDSEGFIHRLNSFVMASNDKLFVKSYLKVCPKPNILIYVKEDFSVIKERLENTENYEDKQKYKYTLENMFNNSQIIYEEMKKYSKKIFLLNSKNFADVKNEIIKYIKSLN